MAKWLHRIYSGHPPGVKIMNIAILGGSFNPPHNGHLLIASQVLDYLKVDEVWLMPVFSHPFHKHLIAPDKRYAMTRFLESAKIKVSDYEIKQNKVSYTIETLNNLSQLYPDHQFSWIIGSDQIVHFQEWKGWQEIINKYRLIIFPRESLKNIKDKNIENFDMVVKNKNTLLFDFDNVVTINLSSSMVRNKIKNNQTIKYLVPEKVEEYIVKNNLYT